jgi:hypothetical protein
VVGHELVEVLLLLLGVGQVAVQQQVAGVEEVALRGQLLDRVAAVQQLALVAVDVGDGAVARRGRQEARVVGELAGLPYSLRMSITSGPMLPL